MEWKPIETAPRDGTNIRVYFADGHQDDRYWKRGWCKNVGYPVKYNYRFAGATHWMPLPPAPTE